MYNSTLAFESEYIELPSEKFGNEAMVTDSFFLMQGYCIGKLDENVFPSQLNFARKRLAQSPSTKSKETSGKSGFEGVIDNIPPTKR